MTFEIICKQPDEQAWKVTGWERKEAIAKMEARKQARLYPDVSWAVRKAKTGEIVQ